MSNEKLFVYGTLRYPKIQKKVIGRVVQGKRDALVGYLKKKVIIEGETYPMLIPSNVSKQEIEGQVLELTPEELAILDIYETGAYERIKVTLKSGERAEVYVFNAKNDKA